MKWHFSTSFLGPTASLTVTLNGHFGSRYGTEASRYRVVPAISDATSDEHHNVVNVPKAKLSKRDQTVDSN